MRITEIKRRPFGEDESKTKSHIVITILSSIPSFSCPLNFFPFGQLFFFQKPFFPLYMCGYVYMSVYVYAYSGITIIELNSQQTPNFEPICFRILCFICNRQTIKGEQTKMCEFGVDSGGKVLKDEEREVLGLRKTSSTPDPASFAKECISEAEEAAGEVLNCIRPTLDSEEERSDVIDHLRTLIKTHVECDVFPYGSVPLKTYLPHGDIDLTVLSSSCESEQLAHDVLAVLRAEELNENSEYHVSDTQFIDAEVKLVKCIVQNTVVDISFNQLGGLSALCFLEQVDRLVGENHLFKRSIILIKTWCFYESRILGATHGLISTYALEILILYIFHLFHSFLSGPLEALYTFLVYYTQFDWDNYCISLKGPVFKSSLPNIVVRMPGIGLNGRLLDEDFIENCMDMLSVPFKWLEANQKPFQRKHLNIIDPLKENNNLGRSVHRGNYFRIRSAFRLGARKLGHVLSLPRNQVADETKKFFANTLSRHGKDLRNRVERLNLNFGDEASSVARSASHAESSSEYDMLMDSSDSDFDNNSVGVEENSFSSFENEPDRCLATDVSLDMTSESCYSENGVVVSGNAAITGNLKSTAKEPRKIHQLNSADSAPQHSTSLSENVVKSPVKTESLEAQKLHERDFVALQKFGLESWLEDVEKHVEIKDTRIRSVLETTGSDSSPPKASVLQNLRDDSKKTSLSIIEVESEAVDYLADLAGDYDGHLRNFLYGQLTISFSSTAHVLSNSSSSPSSIQEKNQLDPVKQAIPLSPNHHFQLNTGTLSMGQTMYSVADYVLPASAFYTEARTNTRGTGTYFPSMVNGFYRDRSSQGRGRGKAPGNRHQFNRYRRNNGSNPAFGKSNSFDSGSHGQRKSDARFQSPFSVGDGNRTNCYLNSSCRIEFGSVGNLAEEVIAASARVRGPTQCGLTGNAGFNCNK